MACRSAPRGARRRAAPSGRAGGSHRGALAPRRKLQGRGAVGGAAKSVATRLRTPQTCKGRAVCLLSPAQQAARQARTSGRASGLHLVVVVVDLSREPSAAQRRTERADLRHDARALNALCQLGRCANASRGHSALGARWRVLPATRLSKPREHLEGRRRRGLSAQMSAQTSARSGGRVVAMHLRCTSAARGAHHPMLLMPAPSSTGVQSNRPVPNSDDSSDHQRLHHAGCSLSAKLALALARLPGSLEVACSTCAEMLGAFSAMAPSHPLRKR